MTSRLLLLLSSLLCLAGCANTAGDAAYKRGKTAWDEGRDDAAIKIFSAALKESPDHAKLRLSLARLHYERGEKPHLAQLDALGAAARAEEARDFKKAKALQAEAERRQTEARIEFRVSRELLDGLLEKSKEDEIIAHAAYLRARIAVFFEEYQKASKFLRLAAEKGKVDGTRKARFLEFAEELEKRGAQPLLPRRERDVNPFH